MTDQVKPPALSDYAELAEKLFEQVCDDSTKTGMPVGVVLASVIYFLSIEAQVTDIPELLLHTTISSAADTYRAFDCAQVQQGGGR